MGCCPVCNMRLYASSGTRCNSDGSIRQRPGRARISRKQELVGDLVQPERGLELVGLGVDDRDLARGAAGHEYVAPKVVERRRRVGDCEYEPDHRAGPDRSGRRRTGSAQRRQPPLSASAGASPIRMSSMRRIMTATSVAEATACVFISRGSRIPACQASTSCPETTSNPHQVSCRS